MKTRESDPLDSIKVRDLFMALRWTDGKEFAEVMRISQKSPRFKQQFEYAAQIAKGLNQFTATELVRLTEAYLQRKN